MNATDSGSESAQAHALRMASVALIGGLAVFVILWTRALGGPSGVRFSLALSSHRLGPGGTPVYVIITIRTGESAQTVGLGLNESGWPSREVVGSPVAFSEEHVWGGGVVTGHFAAAGVGYARFTCFRGTWLDGGGVDLRLPPRSTTHVAYRLGIAAPPWPGMRATISAYAYVPAVGSGATRTIPGQTLTFTRPSGVNIHLSARAATRIGAGRAIAITASTVPFATARIARPGPGLAADRSCEVVIRVRGFEPR
jgi:hypothetical protein